MNHESSYTLRNSRLIAHLDARTGLLSELCVAKTRQVLVTGSTCSYHDASGAFPQPDAQRSWQVVAIRARSGEISTVLRSPIMQVSIRYALGRHDPLLSLTVQAKSLATPKQSVTCNMGLLTLMLDRSFNDMFEDEKDLYFDGAEIPSGNRDQLRNLRPWRVFYRERHRDGLLIATPTKIEMSALSIRERSIGICPYSRTNYLTVWPTAMELSPGRRWRSTLQLVPLVTLLPPYPAPLVPA